MAVGRPIRSLTSSAAKWALVLVILVGCQRTVGSRPASSAASDDYRKLSETELANLIRTKLGVAEVAPLQRVGPNHYTTEVPSPDGTIKLPLDVTVEEHQIVCLTKTPAGSTKQIITPQGLKDGGLQMK